MQKNTRDYIDDFRASMAEVGLVCDEIMADGQIHRCDTSSKNGKGDGAYVLHLDGGIAVGGYENHQAGTGWCVWKPERAPVIDPEEKRRMEAALAAMRAKRDADTEARRKRASELASKMWSEARPADFDHPYLARKRVKAHDGVRVGNWKVNGHTVADTLLVPLTDGQNILSLQGIFPEKQPDIGRDKDFLPGGKKNGCFFPIGDDVGDTVVLCEGYATGASIHEATGLPVYVAFDSGNMLPVALNLRATFPHAEVIVAADNDRFSRRPDGTSYNPGLEAANKILQSIGNAKIVIPTFNDEDISSSDWNDYASINGMDDLRQHFIGAASEAKQLFPFVDVSELVADIKPVSWLVRDYFERDSLALVYGAPGGGKSFFSVDIACSIATGQPWMGHKVHAGPVFYIAGEGHNGLARRFRAWEVAREVSLEAGKIYKSGEAMHVLDEASVANVSAQIADICERIGQEPAMVVIDTLARNFGPGDENKTEDMSKFVSHVDTHLRHRFKCCVLLVHHSGHNAERARGSSALKAAVDAEYEIAKDDGGNVRIRTTKMKDAEIPPELMLRLRGVELPGLVDEDGAPVTSAILEVADDLINSKVAEKFDGAVIKAKDVLAILDRGWLSIRALCESLECKKNQGEAAMAALKRYGFVDGKAVTPEGKDALSRIGHTLTEQDKPIWKRGE